MKKLLIFMLILSLSLVPVVGENLYKDVDENHIYYKEIKDVTEKGLMQGNNNFFYPDELLTRAAFATVLSRQSNFKEISANEISYSDVKKEDWFFEAVNKMTKQGLLKGFGDGTFRPNNSVTREQFIYVLYEWSKKEGLEGSNIGESDGFLDSSSINAYAKEAMDWAVSAGLLREKSLYPGRALTRKEAAVILSRWTNLKAE